MNRPSSDRDHPQPRQRPGAEGRRGFARSLTAEWERTARRHAAIRRARSWAVVTTHFEDLHGLLALAGYERRDDPAAEGVLRRLVEQARSDELAARVVVQRIVPGLIGATRHRPSDMTADEALQDLVAAAWIAVRSYDPGRSPSCISAALINDAVYRVFKSDRRRREQRPEVLVDPQEWRSLTATEDHVLDRVREVLVEAALHDIDPVNVEALRRVLLTGSTEKVAAAMGISPRAVRYRCSRVADELAAIARVA
jgi:DNA-directed RNA polymerase specialized sigma24 family protein